MRTSLCESAYISSYDEKHLSLPALYRDCGLPPCAEVALVVCSAAVLEGVSSEEVPICSFSLIFSPMLDISMH